MKYLDKDSAIVKSFDVYLDDEVTQDDTEATMDVSGCPIKVTFKATASWESDEEPCIGVGGHDSFRTYHFPVAELDIETISIMMQNGIEILMDIETLPEGMSHAIHYKLEEEIASQFRSSENDANEQAYEHNLAN